MKKFPNFVSHSDYNEHGEIMYPFLKGRKGGYHLVHDNFIYRSNFRRQGVQRNIYYWECINNRKGRCRGRLKTVGDKLYITNSNGKINDEAYYSLQIHFYFTVINISVSHNHESQEDRIEDARVKGSMSLKSLCEAAKEYEEKSQSKIEILLEWIFCLIKFNWFVAIK